jgi:hypothetical protein
MRVNKDYTDKDMIAVCIDYLGWVNVVPGTVTELDSDTFAFVDDEGDQVNVLYARLIATAVAPLADEPQAA